MTVPSHDTSEIWGKKEKKKNRKDKTEGSQALSSQAASKTDMPQKSGKKRKGATMGDNSETPKRAKDSVDLSKSEKSEPTPQKTMEQTSQKKKPYLKKKKKQIQKKKKTDQDSEEDEETSEKKESKTQKVAPQESMKLALDYLRLWEDDRSIWRFQKIRQVWLLQNMYNSKKVPEEEFEILLRYLEKLEGKAKMLTIKKSEELMETLTAEMEKKENKEGEEEEEEDEETKSKKFYDLKKMKKQWKRAKQVLQILT